MSRVWPWSVVLVALLAATLVLAFGITSNIRGVSPRSAEAADGLSDQFTGDCANSLADSRAVEDRIANGEGAIVADPVMGTDHEHNFFGVKDGTGTNHPISITDDITAAQMQAMTTLCDRESNHSLYWAPRLYWGSGANNAIDGYRAGVYYQRGNIPTDTHVEAFERGFKMVARPEDDSQTPGINDEARVWWYCGTGFNVDDSKNSAFAHNDEDDPFTVGGVEPGKCSYNGQLHDRMGVTIQFPNCWNGEGANSGFDPQISRVRHSVNGSCGAWHVMPTINLLIDYKIPENAVGEVRVQTDDGPGSHLQMHADYFNSEGQNELTQWCINDVDAPPTGISSTGETKTVFCRH